MKKNFKKWFVRILAIILALLFVLTLFVQALLSHVTGCK